jgi:hypothetical protein
LPACGGLAASAPSPLWGEGWNEERVLRRASLPFCIGLVARLFACGGLSDASRRPSDFSLRAHATAGSGGERRSRPEGRRAEPVPDSIRECPESREVAKRNGLWSPPTLQALALEGSGTDRTLSVRPTATPHRRRQLRPGRGCRNSLPSTRSNVAEPLHSHLVADPPHRHSSERWNPVPWVGVPRPPLRLPDDRIFVC